MKTITPLSRSRSRSLLSLASVLTVLALPACSSDTAAPATAPHAAPAPGGLDFDVVRAKTAVDDADQPDASGHSAWDKAEVVQVELSEFAFSPSQLTFQVGKTYKLVLTNVGSRAHDFVSDDFFRSIAAKSVSFKSAPAAEPDASVTAPYFVDIDLEPGKSVEVSFIPLAAGDFHLICEVPGHEEHGMHGDIQVIN